MVGTLGRSGALAGVVPDIVSALSPAERAS